jgi:hypothetical protein
MLKSKFIDIIKTFSKEELKQFKDFLRSPFHNTNQNVVKLFDIIRKYLPEFESASLEKENLFKKLYPGKKYNDTVMRILSSDLLSLAEEFLSYRRYKKNPFTEKKFLLEELKERKGDALFNKHFKEAEALLNKEGSIDETYFLNRYELETAKVNFLISADRQDESGAHLLKTGEYLVNFFLMNVLNISQELTEHEEVLNEKYDFNLADMILKNTDLEKVMAYLKERNYEYYHVLEIYYYMNRCAGSKTEVKNYALLKDAIGRNLGQFRSEAQYNLFLILESCCITLMRYGIGIDYADLMNVYEMMLEYKIFSDNRKNFMQANLFRNIFYTSVALKKYEWAEKFVNDYHSYLLPEQRADMFNYTKSVLNFERKRFAEALEQISKVNYNFFVFRYEAKTLTMKILYELKLFEQALSLIDSFSHFLLKNKKVPEIYKRQFMNFLKYCRTLIKKSQRKEQFSSLDAAELKKQISGEKEIINKTWLLEKAEEYSRS